MARAHSEAERLRAHGEAFRLALQLGCTPKEAENELRVRRAQAQSEELTRRLQAKMGAPIARLQADDERPSEPWMMRE